MEASYQKISIYTAIVFRNYLDNCEKRCCSCNHKQCKTLLKDHVVRLKIISLYIYKDLLMLLSEYNRLLSSANIIGLSIFDHLSSTYMRNKRGPKLILVELRNGMLFVLVFILLKRSMVTLNKLFS